jgi:hypothetical protein
MVTAKIPIIKFSENGWTCIVISKKNAQLINPDTKVSFRVRGTLDNHSIEKKALFPMGDGTFLLPINAVMRKATGKKEGDVLRVSLEADKSKIALSRDLIKCLNDDPEAKKFFNSLSASHQRYYSKWIEDAKTAPTKTRRLVICLTALGKKMNYGELLKHHKTFTV